MVEKAKTSPAGMKQLFNNTQSSRAQVLIQAQCQGVHTEAYIQADRYA